MMGKLTSSVIWIVLSGLCFFKGMATTTIDIDISTYDPTVRKTHTFHQFINTFDGNTTEILVRSNGTTVYSYYIIQAHSFRYNVSLAHIGSVNQNVTGRNVGLLSFFKLPFVNTFTVEKLTEMNVTIMIAVTIFDGTTPIPGGCANNVELKNIYPFIYVKDGPDVITIETESPFLHNSCDPIMSITVQVYHMYLPGQNFDPFRYYEGILKMLSIDDVRKNGRLVSTLVGRETLNIKKFFSSYVGVGEVFAILITNMGKTSAYIPAVSYGEDIELLIEKEKSGTSGNVFYVILFSILPFVALLIIYRGHLLFHFTTFSLGLSCGTLISFFVLGNHGASTVDDKFAISLLIGFLYGIVWLCLWCRCGIPLLSASLAFLHTGTLIAAILYHTALANMEEFQSDGLYWSVFFSVVIVSWLVLSLFTMHGHIFSCAFLGSYILLISTLNYWMEGDLQYVVINMYRRLFVPNFNTVIIDPPYPPRDIFIAVVGCFFIMHGYFRQVQLQRGRPPFPPHTSHRFIDERSPLLLNH